MTLVSISDTEQVDISKIGSIKMYRDEYGATNIVCSVYGVPYLVEMAFQDDFLKKLALHERSVALTQQYTAL